MAFDTSHPLGSVALSREGTTLGEMTFSSESSHLVAIGNCAERLLSTSGLRVEDVTRLAIVIGPGSFTGLRIGLGFVKGWAAARTVEVVTMSSLELLALGRSDVGGDVCAMIDARRGEVYCAAYRAPGGEPILPPGALSPEACLDALSRCPDAFVGSGAVGYADIIRERWPDAQIFGDRPSTALLARAAGEVPPMSAAEISGLEPLYIRASGAERKRLRPVDPS